MKKLLLSIFASVLALAALAQSSLYQQPVVTSSDQQISSLLKSNIRSKYSDTWNVGSAKKLEGDIYILEIWLTEYGTSWSKSDMSTIQGKIESAANWLKSQAASYGKTVNFKYGSFAGQNNTGIQMRNLPRSYAEAANDTKLMNTALQLIGYSSDIACYKQLTGDYGCDNAIVLVLFNNDGWSCANNYSVGHQVYGYNYCFLENAYIFKTESNIYADAQTIAHEILHLFGAWDMYADQVSKKAEAWAKYNYPNEIMLQVSSPLNQLMISPLTAWLTGLSTKYDEWYWYFLRQND